MNPRTPIPRSADRGAWVARAAVIIGLVSSLGVLVWLGDGSEMPSLAGMDPSGTDVCIGFAAVGAIFSGAL